MLKKGGSKQRLLDAKAFFEGKKADLEAELQSFADASLKRVLAPGSFGLTGQLREILHRLDEVKFLLAQIESALEKKALRVNETSP